LKLKTFFKSFFLRRLVATTLPRDEAFQRNRIQTILVFRFDRIGDMVVTTPFLFELKRLFPTADIDVLCSEINESVLYRNPSVRKRLIFSPNLKGLLTLWASRNSYDLVIDLNHSVIWRDMFMIRLLNPVWAASTFKEGRYGVAGRSLAIYRVMPSEECDWTPVITGKYLNLVEHMGGNPDRDFQYRLYPNHQGSRLSDVGLKTNGSQDGVWVINQHGGRPQMALRDKDVRRVTEMLIALNQDRLVIFATSPQTYDATKSKRDLWFPNDRRVRVYAPTPNPIDICDVFARAKGLITPDTSLVHMASALQLPMVVVFANERDLYEQWKPPSTAWQRHLFSKNSKSLDGYDQEEFMNACKELAELKRADLRLPS
jgi:ADP-heptose:LPS heptosyltransferase